MRAAWILALLSWHQAADAAVVTRTAPYRYVVDTGDVVYSIEADTLSQADPRRMGVGQFRLRRASWVDSTGASHPIMACGQCNVLDALSPDGVDVAWAGGGHGLEGDHLLADVQLDGVSVDIAVGDTVPAQVVQFFSVTALYSATGEPLSSMSVAITVDDAGLEHWSRSVALVDHYRHRRHEAMLSSDVAPYFDSWSILDGGSLVVSGAWPVCESANTYVLGGNEVVFSSSSLGIALHLQSEHGVGTWTVQNRETCQRKSYLTTVPSIVSVLRNDVRETSERFWASVSPPK